MPLSKLTACAMFVALIAVLAQIAIPLPFSPVPFTGQVVGVLLAGTLLGPRSGLLTITAYLLLGAAGAPVFSLARGGIYMLTGPTGGYLWGFIPAVLITGLLMKKFQTTRYRYNAAALFPAIFIIYLSGALQLGCLMQYSIKQVLLVGVLPFIPFDIIKIFLAAALSVQIKKSLQHNGLGHILN